MSPGLRAAKQIASEIAMRSQRDIERARKTSTTHQARKETDWQQAVSTYTRAQPCDLTTADLKLFIVVLLRYLLVAPTLEDQLSVQSFISLLRRELEQRCCGPLIELDSG